jgi:hypothetical protein
MLYALMVGGFTDEAVGWHHCCCARRRRSASLQTLYGIGGERRLIELELPVVARLRGLEAGSHRQRGRRTAAARRVRRADGRHAFEPQARITDMRIGRRLGVALALMKHLATSGASPTRASGGARPAPPVHHSKVMTWVAFDRANQGDQSSSVPMDRLTNGGRFDRQCHDDVCAKGFDAGRGIFTQYVRIAALDASC